MRPFAVARRALGADELDALRAEADAMAAAAPPDYENGCVLEPVHGAVSGAWRVDKRAYEASRASSLSAGASDALWRTLPAVAAAHLGVATPLLFNEHYVVKPPRSDVEFSWHRAAPRGNRMPLARVAATPRPRRAGRGDAAATDADCPRAAPRPRRG